MENNVRHDVYNVDVCIGAQGGKREEGKREGSKKEKKIGMRQAWGEKSGDEKEEKNRSGGTKRDSERERE